MMTTTTIEILRDFLGNHSTQQILRKVEKDLEIANWENEKQIDEAENSIAFYSFDRLYEEVEEERQKIEEKFAKIKKLMKTFLIAIFHYIPEGEYIPLKIAELQNRYEMPNASLKKLLEKFEEDKFQKILEEIPTPDSDTGKKEAIRLLSCLKNEVTSQYIEDVKSKWEIELLKDKIAPVEKIAEILETADPLLKEYLTSLTIEWFARKAKL